MTVQTYKELAETVLARPPRLGPVRLVAVDGPAGSGKSTFAGRLAVALRAAGARVAEVHVDDLLEGWADLVSFWPRLEEWVLGPLRRGRAGTYRVYDWHAGDWGPEWRSLPVPDVLVLEGVTAARAEVRNELSLGVFLVADRELRLARGIARDGEALRPHWVRWMVDEDAHFALDRTSDHVEIVVDGAPTVPHDVEAEYVSAGVGRRPGLAGGRSGEYLGRGGGQR